MSRMIPIATTLAAGLLLSACSGNYSAFDPTDWITGEMFYSKPKLAGDRKPVFPEGVPGVPEGVPKELVKGNQQATLQDVPPEEPVAKPAPKPAAKPVVRPRTASAPPRQQPAPQQPAPQQANAPWPDQQQQPKPQSQPATPNGGGMQANWPPPDANTFSR